MKAEIETYQSNELTDNIYIVKEIKEYKFKLIKLYGNAKITHVGGNGRFKFILDGITYITEFTPNICTDEEKYGFNKTTDKYYDYFQVSFNIDIKSKWYEYYKTNSSKDYWKPIV